MKQHYICLEQNSLFFLVVSEREGKTPGKWGNQEMQKKKKKKYSDVSTDAILGGGSVDCIRGCQSAEGLISIQQQEQNMLVCWQPQG